MSYSNLRKQTQQAAQTAQEAPQTCGANGCPCRGTISTGGPFFCAAHAFSESDRWPSITETLREHDWLIAFHDDIRRMDRKSEDWRAFAIQFWTGVDDYCAPDPKENAVPYMNRMRSELTYRCGLNKRPAPRLPKEVQGKGFFANRKVKAKA